LLYALYIKNNHSTKTPSENASHKRMSMSHPMIASELVPAERIASQFLHGVGNEARPC